MTPVHTVRVPLLLGAVSVLSLLSCLFFPQHAEAEATLVQDTITIEKAIVLEIADEATSQIPGTGVTQTKQLVTAKIIGESGPDSHITFENDFTPLASGDVFYLRHTTNELDGTNMYAVADLYRLPMLGLLAAVFFVLLFVFGGKQGVRGLLALAGSILLIVYLLIPGMLQGISPSLLATGVGGMIIILGSYITHGFNKTTSIAVVGMLVTVVLTGIAGYIAIHATHLTGYANEEIAYLNFDFQGKLDILGLLYAGVMIGLLGVLYDIAIGQAIAVEELCAAGAHLSRREIYARGIRIGREHIGALVNTLAIAYVGSSLPLLLLVQNSSFGLAYMINSELFATEIIRILIGAIGIILAVPITTFIAAYTLGVRRAAHTLA